MATERIWDAGQRLAQMFAEHIFVGHIVRHFTQAIHIVGKRDQPRRHIADFFKRAADHCGAQNFVKRTDMRQSRWAVAGFKKDGRTIRLPLRIAFEQLACLFIRPSLAHQSRFAKGSFNAHLFVSFSFRTCH